MQSPRATSKGTTVRRSESVDSFSRHGGTRSSHYLPEETGAPRDDDCRCRVRRKPNEFIDQLCVAPRVPPRYHVTMYPPINPRLKTIWHGGGQCEFTFPVR